MAKRANTIGTMTHDQFTKLFAYMQKRFDTLEAQLETKASVEQVDRLHNTVEALAKRTETDEQERLVMGEQLRRHSEWIERAAKQLKIKYQNT